jgi:hypothetical protein
MITKEVKIYAVERNRAKSKNSINGSQRTHHASIDSSELCPFTLEPAGHCVIREHADINRTCPFTLESSFQMKKIYFRRNNGFLDA